MKVKHIDALKSLTKLNRSSVARTKGDGYWYILTFFDILDSIPESTRIRIRDGLMQHFDCIQWNSGIFVFRSKSEAEEAKVWITLNV